MRTLANRVERLLSQPSSSLEWGRTRRLLGFLINANYAGAVINLGTQVLADENKTIPFLPLWVPAAIIKEPQSEIVWVRTPDWEAGISYLVYVCVSVCACVCPSVSLSRQTAELHADMSLKDISRQLKLCEGLPVGWCAESVKAHRSSVLLVLIVAACLYQ